jgi:small multidrug resistance family-3 protein
VTQNIKKIRKILITLFFFLLAGLCKIGGGYLVWQWIREKKGIFIGLTGGIV